MLKIHSFQHVPFEGLGSIAAWAQAAGHKVSTTKLYAGEQPPPADLIDWLVIMGGPMGTTDEESYPWLVREKNYIRRAIDQGKKVLGICLGAQLIAEVLGAAIYPNSQQEIGWFPVHSTPAAEYSPLINYLPDGLEVFHWHGDTFDIPAGAIHLMSSQACKNQAFIAKGRVLGFQFHLETTPESAAALVKNCADELKSGPFVQDVKAILREKIYFEHINQSMKAILEYLAGIPM